MSEGDFLSRWSRRKRAQVREAPAEPEAAPEPVEPETPEEEEALLAKFNLPRPENLQAGDDFSAFMAEGVPQFLRKRALRVLWRSNPVLANLDGLNDYDDDFTSPELTQKVLATAYQVGRGIVSQVVEPEDCADAETVAEADETTPDEPPKTLAEAPKIQPLPELSAPDADDEPILRPRRMRFEDKT